MNKQTLILKTIFIGMPAAGKTSCIRRLIYNTFDQSYKLTIGVDFSSYSVTVEDKDTQEQTNVMLQIWDISGQENSSQTISKTLRRGAFCAIIVADLSSDTFFEDIKKWYDLCDQELIFPNTDDVQVPKILFCNKIDLEKSKEFYNQQSTQEQLKQFKFDKIYTVSAVSGENLKQAMQDTAELLQNMTKQYTKKEDDILDILTFDENSTDKTKQKQGCC